MQETNCLALISFGDLGELAQQEKLWAIFDPADDLLLQEKLASMPREACRCLYRGSDQTSISDAPHLLRVNLRLLRWLYEVAWQSPWGIFLISRAEINSLRRHLRRFLVIKTDEGEPVCFRYYDPRVLPVFLDSCNPHELREFFGPILAFAFVNGKDKECYIRKCV